MKGGRRGGVASISTLSRSWAVGGSVDRSEDFLDTLPLGRKFVHHLLRLEGRRRWRRRLRSIVVDVVISMVRSIGKCFSAHHESDKSPPYWPRHFLRMRVQLSLYTGRRRRRRPTSQSVRIRREWKAIMLEIPIRDRRCWRPRPRLRPHIYELAIYMSCVVRRLWRR